MKIFLPLLLISQLTYAQVKEDSLFQKTDSIKAKLEKPIQSLDSTAIATKQKVDFIKNEFDQKVDSLQASYQKVKSNIVVAQTRIQQKIDSLRTLNLPTEKLQARSDSLQQDLSNLQKRVAGNIDSLKYKVAGKFNSLNISPEAKEQVAKYSSTLIDKVDLPFIDKGMFNKTEIGEIGTQLPGIDQPNLTENLSDMKNAEGAIPGVNNAAIKEKLGPVSEIKEEVKEIKQQIQDGNALAVVEEKATQLESAQALQKVLPTESAIPLPTNGAQAQQEMKEQVKKMAINHFAGKEVILQGAMNNVSKYKKKYSNVKTLKDIPKKRPNELKDKPFYERLVKGIMLQPFKNNEWMIDINPYVGYRFTTKLSAKPS
jgi:hypothetical protein